MTQTITTITQHYLNSPYAEFHQEHRLGGSFKVQMIKAEQEGIDLWDPAVSQVMFVGTMKASARAELDFGGGNKVYSDIRSNMITVQPANQACRFRIAKPHNIMVAAIPAALLSQKLDEVGVAGDPLEACYAQLPDSPQALVLLEQIWTAMEHGGPANDLLVDGCLINLVAHMMKLGQHNAIWERPQSANVRLDRVLDYIEAHLSEPIRMDDLAAVSFLSTIQFSRSFKRQMRQSPHQYVTLRRVSRAKQLLVFTRLSTTEIAFMTGFGSSSHFSSVFSKFAGIGPTDYRRQA
jgi:AraC family transcriptional regulator